MRVILLVLAVLILASAPVLGEFRAGAAAVNVTPLELPVIRNGGFLEGTAQLVSDPLFARALAKISTASTR